MSNTKKTALLLTPHVLTAPVMAQRYVCVNKLVCEVARTSVNIDMAVDWYHWLCNRAAI